LVKRGYEGDVHSDEMFEQFGIGKRGYHDALEDARIAANILRKIVLGQLL